MIGNRNWPQDLTFDEAAWQSVLRVTVLERPTREVVLPVDPADYGRITSFCHPDWTPPSPRTRTARPTDFDLTLFRVRDAGRWARVENLTACDVMRACAGYQGRAWADTRADRKTFGARIADAGRKRRGGELDGSAGYGRAR